MSEVTAIIVTYHVVEIEAHGDGFPKRQFRTWLHERGYDPLISVEGSTASWDPGSGIMIGGYNHFPEADFEHYFLTLPWANPETAVLILTPPEGPSRVTRPTRQYQRFLRRVQTHMDAADEKAELVSMLLAAPGTKAVEVLGPHPKGGYRTTFDLLPDAIDDFISHVEQNGWLSVL